MSKFFWLDYETFLIQPGCSAPPPVCMVYAWDNEAPALVHVKDPAFRELLLEALRSDAIVVAHNAAFEVLVTMAFEQGWTPRLFEKLRKGEIRCTMVREKLIRIGRGDQREDYGLDDCLEAWGILIKLDKESHWRPRFGTLIDVPISEWPQDAKDYVLGDIAVRDLYWAQETAGPEYLVDQHHQMRAAVALALTSAWGFATDPEAAEVLYDETVIRLEEYKEQVLAAGLARWKKEKGVIKVARDKKAAEARIVKAYAAQGREAPRGKVTEKAAAKGAEEGNLKLDEEACENSGDPLLLAYTRFGQANTLLGKVRRLRRSPIQCRYNVLVQTGRTSCTQGDDPKPGEAWTAYGMQVQNLPKVGEEIEEDNG